MPIQNSARINSLLGDAIALMMLRCFGQRLTEADSRYLAQLGSVKAVHAQMKDRMSVKRATPGVRSNEELQQRLALLEVGSSHLSAKEQRALFDKALAQEAEQQRIKAASSETAAKIERLIRELSESTPELRSFLRDANRLYSAQKSKLSFAIVDPSYLSDAMAGLDEIYSRHIQRAQMLMAADS
jgi:hypothetical protein